MYEVHIEQPGRDTQVFVMGSNVEDAIEEAVYRYWLDAPRNRLLAMTVKIVLDGVVIDTMHRDNDVEL